MPPEPSVTSASAGPRRCTLRYSSALLPKSFERPGPKSVSPATYCSGVELVVWCRWIVDMRAPLSLPETPGILILVLITPFDTAHLGSDELLSAVDVIGCAREGGVGHDVYGERGHVRRSDHASDGKCVPKLIATIFELIAQQFRGQRRVHKSRGDEVDSHGSDFKCEVSGQG